MTEMKNECKELSDSNGSKWGIFCPAAQRYNPSAPPRYTAHSHKEAKGFKKLADAECQSGCNHPIVKI